MTPQPAPQRKKLIEVALPLEAINVASAKEKEPFTRNHPRSIHIWWARRPLVACRAVLFASLVDDPDSDPQFRKPDGSVDEEAAGAKRAELFDLIEDLVRWENSNNPTVLNAARAEIARCVASRQLELGRLAKDEIIQGPKKGQKHSKGPVSGEGITAWDVLLRKAKPTVVNAFLAEYGPPVLDPFCGGGSIPVEAQRLGLRAYGSDLNPVPVLITKALIELPPKFAGNPPVNPDWRNKSAQAKAATVWEGAHALANDVQYYGNWIRDQAEKRLARLYPKVKITAQMAKDRSDLREYVGDEVTIIAWLWARTVVSPSPLYQGTPVPLVRGFWLSKKAGKQAWLEPVVNRRDKTFRFVIRTGTAKAEERKKIEAGTKIGRGCKFRCLLSDEPIPEEHVKSEGMAGRLSTTLLAVVAQGARERLYLPADAVPEVATSTPETLRGIETPLAGDKRAIWCLLYGLDTFDKLFTARQLTTLVTYSDLVTEVHGLVKKHAEVAGATGTSAADYADAVAVYLALGMSRWTDLSNAICSWNTTNQNVRALFARQGIPMSWDFCELSPFSSVAPMDSTIDSIVRVLTETPPGTPGVVEQTDAVVGRDWPSAPLISTDPPYYDNIGYADLSDFFYVWLRRTLVSRFPQLFATLLTPKTQELIASPYRHEGGREAAQDFFEKGLGKAFDKMRDTHHNDFPLTVYYAFKQSETEGDDDDGGNQDMSPVTASTGWETMLSGLIRSGFSVSGTWPMRTERSTRSVGIGTNALASSIVLVCRQRPSDAPLATRKQFISALGKELPDALRNLQRGNIAPVDLAQAAIGPGMAVFTRYSKVMESDGTAMSVRTALGLINQSLDEVLAEQEGEFDSDTRWALAWFEQFGMEEGQFGVAETLSKAKNTAVNGLVEAGIIVARAGKVRLVKRSELPDEWNPATDRRLTIWETAQHLIYRLDKHGEAGAAALLHQLGGMAEIARDLAYRLYVICERKKWAEDALAYNGLVIAWPELSKLAQSQRGRGTERQQELY